MSERGWYPPSADDIVRLGQEILADLPEPFRTPLRDVPVVVQELAEDEVVKDLGLENPYDLTGLYAGIPVGLHEARESGAPPDMIFLFRQAILAEWCETDVDFNDLVRNVLIHEIAHHFGWSDEDIERVEFG
ncbi:MAG TPA: metallopeptidase family protein [Geminicoccus sp.]|uniref:metallopeptidase family protein n=1 Tax=Geminicoccus sp. TaxID=2024832 RepID=UPI002BF1C5EB|nr:metallopeptidase family protein [Geminicoccus sp.]HWL67317.1 metallopeptidase family protein [Geminicoccus sp.]